MGLRKWITAEPTRIVVAAFALVLVASAGAIALVIDRDFRQALAERQDALEIAKTQLEIRVRRIEDLVVVLRGRADGFIRERHSDFAPPLDKRIERWLEVADDDIYSLDGLTQEERGVDTGNLFAIDGLRAQAVGVAGSRQEMAEDGSIALDLTRAIRTVHELNNYVGSISVATPRGVAYVYPWRPKGDFDESFFVADTYQFGLPQANPGRASFWTPVYRSDAAMGPVVGHGTPIYDGNHLAAVVSMEVAVSDLQNFLRAADSEGTLMLTDARRVVLAESASNSSAMIPLVERLPASLHGTVLGTLTQKRIGQIVEDGTVVTFRRFEAAPWTLIEVLPLARLQAAVAHVYALPAATYLGVLIALFVLTYFVVGRTFRQVQAANDELSVAYFTLENAAEGIIWIDRAGVIVEANAMAAIIGGYPHGSLHGRQVGDFIPDLGKEHFDTIWKLVKADVRTTPMERTACHADGHLIPIETTGKYIATRDREFICSFFRDITRRKERDDELRAAKDTAEEATKAKSSFLAMMSHEIRTPMNGVMSMAEMLEQTKLSSDQRSMSQVIRGSARALLTIINDILDFSKIEAGKLDIESVEFSLLDVVEGAGELIAGRSDEKGLALTVDLDPRIPDGLIGDPTRLRQILLNLMGNAVKFTEAGGVTLKVERLNSIEGAERLRFEIVDTGIGLTAEQCGRLFQAFAQAFAQADTSTSRKYGGTGLGLSICKRLVDMMGGRIGVDSTPGEGSTFWLELPFPVVSPMAEQPDPAIDDARVTVLGFEGPQRRALERLLAAAGIAPVFAGFDDELAESDLVLLAATSDREGALAIGRALAAQGRKVALAAPRGMASTLAEADRAGLFSTMTLPLRRRRLWLTVAAALGRADLDEAGAETGSEETGFAPPPVETARAAGVLILVAEDNATNRIVVSRLLAQRGYAHEMAEDGREALARYEASPGYGLLLTDFHMPEMDGFELTAAIRGQETDGRARLPIVALTADALPGTEQRCLDAGMDGYLTKPIDSGRLTATLAKFLPAAKALRRRADDDSKPEEPATPAVPAIDPQILDLARIAETFGAVDADARAFLGNFAGEAKRMVTDAMAALDAGDAKKARHHVHALKGAARSTGATRLGQLASDIQDCLDGDDLDSARLFAGGLAKTADEFADTVASLLEPA